MAPNWLSVVLIASFAILLSYTNFAILRETIEYHSTAPTPWATPLAYPQSVWYAALSLFTIVSIVLVLRATRLLVTGRTAELNEAFQPKAARKSLPRNSKTPSGAFRPLTKWNCPWLSYSVFYGGLALLMIGIPIGPIMMSLGMAGGWLAFGQPFLDSIGSVIWGVHNENMLTAIPVFIMMGELLLRSGIADGMYKGLSIWLTGLPGGLLHSNIGCCALFAATTGSSVACAATIGTVALPELDKRGYDKPMALGSLAAGGTLGILIPPSIALLVYGSLTNNSISKLFVGGVIPGILLTLCFSLYIFMEAIRRPTTGMERKATWKERLAATPLLLPPLIVFSIVMGSIYFGIATPTEAAALGIAVALGFALKAGRLSFAMLTPASSARPSSRG